jgi:hypothetical protein
MLLIGATLGAVLTPSAFAQPAPANAMILAQANDRCMTTYAVRLTRTDATDEAIFKSAVEGCAKLKGQLYTAIHNEYPTAQASELTVQLDAAAKPNFLNLLRRIRSDRAQRAGD